MRKGGAKETAESRDIMGNASMVQALGWQSKKRKRESTVLYMYEEG